VLISVKNRLVFIASSKTGSTSIEAALASYAEINRTGSPQRKHIGWAAARKEYDFLFDRKNFLPETFFRFGVIREPADWVRSWYNYRRFGKHNALPANMSFEEFWAGDGWVKRIRQKDHFIDEDGICRFNLIIPLERPWHTLPVLLKSLDVADVKPKVKIRVRVICL